MSNEEDKRVLMDYFSKRFTLDGKVPDKIKNQIRAKKQKEIESEQTPTNCGATKQPKRKQKTEPAQEIQIPQKAKPAQKRKIAEKARAAIVDPEEDADDIPDPKVAERNEAIYHPQPSEPIPIPHIQKSKPNFAFVSLL
jgi:hypothetical protein